MRSTPLVLGMLLGAGCAPMGESRPPEWADATVEGWLLTERPYGEIREAWARAGDGEIEGRSTALVFEPVLRAEPAKADRGRREGVYAPCPHRVRVRYGGPPSLGVGSTAQMSFEVDGPPGAAHAVEIAGSHPRIEIVAVEGAVPLSGGPGRYVVGAEARVRVAFTSTVSGRGGVRIELLGELPDPGLPPQRSESPFVVRR